MQVSLPVPIEKMTTNVIDKTEEFRTHIYRNYSPDLILQFAGYIYQNVSGLVEIPLYVSENVYSLGELVFKANSTGVGSSIHKVSSVGGTKLVPYQPSEYPNVDLGTTPSGWNYRYVKLHDNFTAGMSFSYTLGTTKHTFEDLRLSAGKIRQSLEDTVTGQTEIQDTTCVYEVSNYDVETVAYCPDGAYYWFNAFISINNVLYARTNVDVPILYTTSPTADSIEFTAISHIRELGAFAKVKPTLDNAPLDAKHYSTATATNTMTYTVQCLDSFDTLALGNIVGDSVSAVFKDKDDIVVDTITDYVIENQRDENNVLDAYRTTVILYSNTVIDYKGTIEITITGDFIALGTIMAGLNVNAGFTHLTFTNKFTDYSPYEKDTWGNITYIDGVRVQVHRGTVSINVTDYDMINRLITSIGGNTIILNGSDTLDNTPPNGSSTFASTMIIGRWKVSELKTKVKDMTIAQHGEYGFTIEEQV